MARIIKQGTLTADTLDTTGNTPATDTFVMYGYAGNDTLTGGANYDQLFGGNDLDSLYGDAASDRLYGDAGADYLNGGIGDDTLWGGAGTDTLDAGAGNDILRGGLGNDTLTGGTGNDTFYVVAGTDTITDLGDGQDRLIVNINGIAAALAANTWTATILDSNNGGVANIDVNGYAVDLTLATGSKGWTLTNSGIAAVMTGSVNADTLTGGTGDDTLTGGAGSDTFNASVGTDTITDWGNGADLLAGTLVAGGQLNVTIDNASTTAFDASTAAATNGVVNVTGGTGNDTIKGGAGNDTLTGGAGNDTFNVTAGADTITDLGNGDVLQNSAIVVATLAANWVATMTSFNDFKASVDVSGFSIDLSSEQGMRPWTLTNSGTAATMTGGSHNDTITGGGGNDNLTGGAGDDTFNVTAGVDTLSDLGNGIDALTIASGATVNATLAGTWTAQPSDTNNGTASINANGYLVGLTYAGGTSGWTLTNTGAGTMLIGSGNNDTIIGGANGDNFNGDGGNDILTGGAGNDSIAGGLGADVLTGGAGADTFDFITGADASIDTITDWGNGADLLTGTLVAGGQLNVTIDNASTTAFDASTAAATSGVVSVTGGTGNDTITGGASNDTLIGGAGNDTIISGTGNDSLDGGAGVDTVSYANASENGTGTGLGVTVDLNSTASQPIQTVVGGEGNDSLIGIESVIGSGFNDTLTGGTANGSLDGGAGDDVLTDGTGNDTLTGGAGNDTFNVNSGVDTVSDLANGYDTLIVAAGATVTAPLAGSWIAGHSDINNGTVNIDIKGYSIELTKTGGTGSWILTNTGIAASFTGSEHNDTITAGANGDRLNGGGGDDLLTGGAGDDMIIGGAGNDTLSYAAETVAITADLSTGILTGAGVDTLFGIENIIGGSGNDSITGDAGDNTLNGGAGDDTLNGGAGNDTASYATETVGITADLPSGFVIGAGTDTLFGIENIVGGSGADTLTGDANNNVLTGGAGDDILDGDVGNDTASYATETVAITANLSAGVATGAGSDTLFGIENIVGGSGADTLTGDFSDNVLTGGTGADTLTGGAGVDAFDFTGADAAIDSITDWGNDSDVLTGTLAVGGQLDVTIDNVSITAFDASIVAATNGVVKVTGGNSGDRIIGGAGNDTLIGSVGADTLTGGAGADAFDLTSVDAAIDSITDWGNGTDVLTGTLTAGALLYVTIDNASTIAFDASTVAATNGAVNMAGGTGNDTLIGGAGNDSLNGGAGADTLTGGAGADDFDLTGADASIDTITDWGNGPDALIGTLIAGSQLNVTIDDASITAFNATMVAGTNGVVNVTGGSSNDDITGGAGNDTLSGGAGNDNIFGGAGDDILAGGAGDDILTGGAGNDTFALSANNSVDSVMNFSSGGDKISLAGGSSPINTVSVAGAGTAPAGTVVFDTDMNLTSLLGASINNPGVNYAVSSNTGDIFYDADGNWSSGFYQIAITGVAVTATDFYM